MGKDLKGKELGTGLSQRKDGRYEARAIIKGIKIDLYDPCLSSLKKAFELEKSKILCDEHIKRKNLTLNEWFYEWFDEIKKPQLKHEPSQNAMIRAAKLYLQIIGEKRIHMINQIDIQKASLQLSAGNYSEKYIKTGLSAIRECMESAVLNYYIKANPCVSIAIKKTDEEKEERRVLEKWEQDLLLRLSKDTFYYEMFIVLLSTGMRIGEFAALQWRDVDFERKVICIRRSMMVYYHGGNKTMEFTTPKTSNSFREIPFFGDVEYHLCEWRKKQTIIRRELGKRWRLPKKFGDLVFTNRMGSPVTRFVLSPVINRIVLRMRQEEALLAKEENRSPREIKPIHPHAFRHTFATRCFEKNLEPLFVQKIMGHANYSTTLSYTHVMEELFKRETEKLSNFMAEDLCD